MKEKAKRLFTSLVLADLLIAIVLLFASGLHECDDPDCLICSIIAFGFAFVGILTMLAILFPITYILTLEIKKFFVIPETKKESTFVKETTENVVNNNSLVKSFVKIQ